jgi:hypothetical protein
MPKPTQIVNRRNIFAFCALLLAVLIASGVTGAQPVRAVRLVPIYTIQGRGLASELRTAWVDTTGLVTGVVANGFYLQDPLGDNDPATSDGIFVYTHERPTVQPGQCVLVERAYVEEFYEKTELSRSKAITPVSTCATTAIAPTTIPLPRYGIAPATLFEHYEGMLVQFAELSGIVQGPTKRFANDMTEFTLLPAALVPYVPGGRVFQSDGAATQALVHLSGALGASVPEVGWGDPVRVGTPAVGVLDFNFGKYQLLLLPNQAVIAEDPPPGEDAAEEYGVVASDADFTVCSFNLHVFGRGSAQLVDDVEYLAHLQQRALAIHERLGDCTVIALQETGTPQDAENLASELRTRYGVDYQVSAVAGPQTANPEFPLTNSLITRRERVQIQQVSAGQSCTPQEYEVIRLPGDCPPGQYPLFDRPPLVVDLTVGGRWGAPFRLRVISNHWKSKAGDETVNVVRRTAQARHVATLVQAVVNADPTAHVMVLGDLNDYYGSAPIETLRSGVTPPLFHTYELLPPLERYTYIYNGASQVLDHILVTPGLAPLLASIDVIRFNVNFPMRAHLDFTQVHQASDHDPVQVRIQPGGAATLGGNLRYPGIHIALVDGAGQVVAETSTDDLGDFRLWNLTPGHFTARLVAPDFLTLGIAEMTLSLHPGYNHWLGPTATHQAAEIGMAAALHSAQLATIESGQP